MKKLFNTFVLLLFASLILGIPATGSTIATEGAKGTEMLALPESDVDSEGIGSGPGFETPQRIAVETDGSLVVVDPSLEAVFRVDPVSGNRTILSDASIGNGTGLVEPVDIAVEADGSLVVVDPALEAVVRVDPVSGDRTILSDASTGSGPGFEEPFCIAVEADGSLVVVDFALQAVVRVDPVSGDRTILAGLWILFLPIVFR